MAITNKKLKAVFFDIDGTLINGQTQLFLAWRIFISGRLGLIKFFRIFYFFIKYKFGLVRDVKKVMEASYSLTKDLSIDDFSNLIRQCFELDIKKRIFSEAISIINDLRMRGFRIILVSNTLQQIVDLLVADLSLDGGIGTVILEKDGKLTGIIDRLMYGENKPKFIKILFNKDFDFSLSYAYTDHDSDIDLLMLVGYPVAVNPNKILKSMAIIKKWPIVYFK